jgi:hypothetical protein
VNSPPHLGFLLAAGLTIPLAVLAQAYEVIQ